MIIYYILSFKKILNPEFNVLFKYHLFSFKLYYVNCKVNICDLCKNNHKKHQMILFSDIGLSQSELNRMENLIKTFENNINNLNKIKTDVESIINEIKLINKNIQYMM